MKALILPEEDFNTEIQKKGKTHWIYFYRKINIIIQIFFLSLGGFTPRGRGRGRKQFRE